jgi:hypothetical protein
MGNLMGNSNISVSNRSTREICHSDMDTKYTSITQGVELLLPNGKIHTRNRHQYIDQFSLVEWDTGEEFDVGDHLDREVVVDGLHIRVLLANGVRVVTITDE